MKLSRYSKKIQLGLCKYRKLPLKRNICGLKKVFLLKLLKLQKPETFHPPVYTDLKVELEFEKFLKAIPK